MHIPSAKSPYVVSIRTNSYSSGIALQPCRPRELCSRVAALFSLRTPDLGALGWLEAAAAMVNMDEEGLAEPVDIWYWDGEEAEEGTGEDEDRVFTKEQVSQASINAFLAVRYSSISFGLR